MSRSTKRFVFFFGFIYFVMFPAFCFRQRIYMTQGLVNRELNDICLRFEWFSVDYVFI